jgi:cytochrome P450
MIAGHETVATSLTWSLYLVSRDRNVQGRLHAEGRAFLAHRDATRLPVARAVIDEALRLYPPIWLITRRAIASDWIDGRKIPGGSLVILSPYVPQRDPSYWTAPNRFDPWRERPKERVGAYFPFGMGPRMCIGRDFALVEATIALAEISARCWLRPPITGRGVSRPVRPEPGVTLRPKNRLTLAVRPI